MIQEINVHEIEGVVFDPITVSSDCRGSFTKLQPKNLIGPEIHSVALSSNPTVGTIRGLHLQVEPFTEEKIVACIKGSSYEVIADLRPLSKTFGKFAIFGLDEFEPRQVFLPKGIAHGFQTLVPNTIIQYVISSTYAPMYSLTINPLKLGITWPLEVKFISEKDQNGITFEQAVQLYASSLNP